jgi:hypothetical protein
MGKYSEVRNEYTDNNNVTHIDAWSSADDNEGGTTIAFVLNGEVYYKDFDAMSDEMAQEVIRETVADQKGELEKEYKYAVVTLEERNGEQEYTHKELIKRDKDADLNKEADEVLRGFFGDENPEGEGQYWDSCMERIITLFSVKEVSKVEFEVLKKHI